MPTPDRLVIFAWNPHTGARWEQVERVLDGQAERHRPDLIVLNEVRNKRDQLVKWAAANGYRLHQERPPVNVGHIPEEGSTALLVTKTRADLQHRRRRVVVMLRPWKVFSHNQWRRPRRYERAWLRTAGGRWKGTGSHWPTNGFKGGNRLAFAESAARCVAAFAATLPGTVVFDVGDHNEKVPTLRRWARLFGARVVGHGPDSIIVRGASVDARVLPKWGSDHHAIRYTLTRKGRP